LKPPLSFVLRYVHITQLKNLNMINKKIHLVIFLFLSFCSYAQIDELKIPFSEPVPVINFGIANSFILKNGLTVLVYPNHKSPKVAIILQIDNPPRLLKENKGVDALLSKMLGNGTTTLPKDKFNEEIDLYGASLYFWDKGASLNVLSEHFPRMLQLMADGAIYPNFNQSDFEKEKASYLANLKSDENNVRSVSRKVQQVFLFTKDYPFGEIIKEENIDNVTLNKVKEYYKSNFIPNKAYLVIVGDVNLSNVKKKVINLFSKWQSGIVDEITYPQPKNSVKTEIDFINMPNAVQSEITVSNIINLKMNSPDYFAALLVNEILSEVLPARLNGSLRVKHGYTHGSYSTISSSKYVGSFKANASVHNEVIDSAIVQLINELNKIRDYKVTKQDLENAKASYIETFSKGSEKLETIAKFALTIKKEKLTNDYYTTYLQKINAVTLNDVQLAAKKYIKPKRAKIIVVGNGLDEIYKLEKLPYKIVYYNKFGEPSSKPDLSKPIPKGITVDSIFSMYFKAIGGREKLKNIKGIVINSEAKIHNVKIEIEEKRMVPNKYSKSTKIMGKSIGKTVFNNDKGFEIHGDEKEYLDGEQLINVKREVPVFPELEYLNENSKLLKIVAVKGNYAYEVTVNNGFNVYYDVKSGLKVKQVKFGILSNGKKYKIITFFSDYRAINGVKFPFQINLNVSHQHFNYKVTSIKINSNVNEDDF